uniref:MYM-type domain-containing protein n=1 Tax=viral metagenome TaxID=1070528 RepID=A0A6C0C3N4_9ZZZZ
MTPKKRGRKPKKKEITEDEPKKVHKKRGRKPKGGKIIQKMNEKINTAEDKKPNIILQLKCCSKDLKNKEFKKTYVSEQENIKSYNMTNHKQSSINYEQYNNISYTAPPKTISTVPCEEDDTDIKEIWEKLRILKIKLHLNEVSDKRSHCFWCTCPFDNPPIHIPRQERNNVIEVYGCFCSPECAVAYLKTEPIDCSVLWERYALLNNIYTKIYNYDKNIKPAPNPYYTLDKYYGNLTIQEYRKLLSKDRLLLVVDKPLTKILPELYEENNELPNIFDDLLNSNTHKQPQYRLKRKQTTNTKTSSLSNNFGLNN